MRENRSKAEIHRDMLIFISQGLAVALFAIPSMYAVYRAWLFFTGAKPGDPISVAQLLVFGFTIIAAIAVGGSFGGLVWVLAMRPVLSREEIEKWLNYGMQSSTVAKWNSRVLDWIYRTKGKNG